MKIRVYYVQDDNLIAELEFSDGKWHDRKTIGSEAALSSGLYAIRVYNDLLSIFEIIVGFTGRNGNLFEAYYDSGSGVWNEYQLEFVS